jgi:hypothetical protein
MMTAPLFVALMNTWLCKRKLPRFLYPTMALTIAASAMVSHPLVAADAPARTARIHPSPASAHGSHDTLHLRMTHPSPAPQSSWLQPG